VRNLNFLGLGIGNGAVLGALALTLVLAFRVSRVVNFAVGTIALYAGYVFSLLRTGQYFLPLPGLPRAVHLGFTPGVLPAIAIAMASAGALGVLLEFAVFRPLRSRAPIISTVSSVGVLIALQALFALRLGTDAIPVKPVFPHSIYRIGSFTVQSDRLWPAVTIIGISMAAGALYRWTRFGLATRAVADTNVGAAVCGIPTSLVSQANWALSAAVAGLAGILLSPIVPLSPTSYTFLVVPALAAALAAGFGSITGAVGVGFLIGMAQSELGYLSVGHHWIPQGSSEFVPLIVIIVVLLAQKNAVTTRTIATRTEKSYFPRARHPLLPSAVILVAGLILVSTLGSNMRVAAMLSCGFALIGLSYVIVTGMAGQISLAQLTLAGVGAYGVSQLSQAGVPFPVAPVIAAAAAALVGVLIGLPSLRLQGIGVAIATMSLSVGVEALWFRNPSLNGGNGGARPVSPRLFGVALGPGAGLSYPRPLFGLLCVGAVAIAVFAVARLRSSRLGTSMLAINANQRAAAANGINVTRTKVLAFALSGFVAGSGGALLAYFRMSVSADSFSAFAALPLLAVAYVSGIMSVIGGVVAGALAAGGLVQTGLLGLFGSAAWFQLISGLGLVLSMRLQPEGIVGEIYRRSRILRSGCDLEEDEALPELTPVNAMTGRTDGKRVMSVSGLSVNYGGVAAVDDVDLSLPAGSIVGLIGPNGAGKTSLLDAVTGFAHSRGVVEFDGKRIDGSRPHVLARNGLVRTFQGVELWHDLSVRENVEVGALAGRNTGRAPEGPVNINVSEALAIMGLRHDQNRLVSDLSQGDRQRVSIARALAARPKLLLLDEPAAGLDSVESLELGRRLRAVVGRGITLLLVDHDMDLVLGVCDLIYVLDLGRLIAEGSPDEIRECPQVIRAYLGVDDTSSVEDEVI
jgi:ABC-type branched-subunit amino acid transport system ATPase component/branched-subunit amino acid ABC-type transport system permease component